MGIDDTRQAEEMDQPEDRPNKRKEVSEKNTTVTIVYKVSNVGGVDSGYVVSFFGQVPAMVSFKQR